MDERSVAVETLPAFLRRWSGRLPALEASLGDADHPLRKAMLSLLPPKRSSGGTWDVDQAAAFMGGVLFLEDWRTASSRFAAGFREAVQGGEPVACGLAQFMAETDTLGILSQIAAARTTDDPAAHLFELLLAQSGGNTRRRLGVYFTPQPLIRFIVRSVDAVLRQDLALPRGLGDPGHSLQIVDPACGTGAFLLEVLRHDAWQRAAQSDMAAWTARLVGIDVMPACCAAGSMILARSSSGPSGLSPGAGDRAAPRCVPRVICANALQDVELAESLFAAEGCLPVILGNPPYSNFGRQNQGNWIHEQLADYKVGLAERKINLDDDFIKFLRWGQYWIDRVGRGVLAMVTNNTYLSGLTHRQMRASLLDSFDRRYLVDLHGDRKRARGQSAAELDENVFEIQQGTAICVLVKTDKVDAPRTTLADLLGSRDEKLRILAESDVLSLPHATLTPTGPQFFFRESQSADPRGYDSWPALNDIFDRYISGVQTKRDALFVGFTAAEVAQRVQVFLTGAGKGQFAADVPPWLRKKATDVDFDAALIRPYLVAPFDIRWIYYDSRLLGRGRHDVMRHLRPAISD